VSEPVVEVETGLLRVRVVSPRVVTLSARPVAEDRGLAWIKVMPGLWISPPSLRSPEFATGV